MVQGIDGTVDDAESTTGMPRTNEVMPNSEADACACARHRLYAETDEMRLFVAVSERISVSAAWLPAEPVHPSPRIPECWQEVQRGGSTSSASGE